MLLKMPNYQKAAESGKVSTTDIFSSENKILAKTKMSCDSYANVDQNITEGTVAS